MSSFPGLFYIALKSKVQESVLQTPIEGQYYFAHFRRIPDDIPTGGRSSKSSETTSAKQVCFTDDVFAFPMIVSKEDFSSIESLAVILEMLERMGSCVSC
jgi:hypothetical protein